MKLLKDLFFILFPRFCAGCKKPLFSHEQSICTFCLSRLPKAKLTEEANNQLERLFWGNAEPEMVSAFLKMSRKGMIHQCIHALKYENRPEVGKKLGMLFGQELHKSKRWPQPDMIIPVPLHPAREKERGYNQSYMIALGIAESMKAAVSTKVITRKKYTTTQTKKTRFQRIENVSDVFFVDKKMIPKGCEKILLVDDVITTGATLDACIRLLKKETSCAIYAVALAMPIK